VRCEEKIFGFISNCRAFFSFELIERTVRVFVLAALCQCAPRFWLGFTSSHCSRWISPSDRFDRRTVLHPGSTFLAVRKHLLFTGPKAHLLVIRSSPHPHATLDHFDPCAVRKELYGELRSGYCNGDRAS